MNFAAFNAVNDYLNPANVGVKQNFIDAVKGFLKASEHVGLAQAYLRAHPAALGPLLNNIWAAIPMGMVGAPRVAHLGAQIDILWKNTIKMQGDAQRVMDRTARETYWTVGPGAGSCPTLEEYAHHGVAQNLLDQLKISKIHLFDYTSLLEALAAPYLAETPANKYTRSHKQAVELQLKAPALTTATNQELLNSDGSYNKTAKKWTDVEACANYWIQEVAAVTGRQVALNAITGWAGGGTNDTFMRLISAGEVDFIKANRVLAPGPTSFERHKWFFFGKGSPGVGHACKVTIVLRGAAIASLMGMAAEVGNESQKTSPHAFLRKTNEPSCIGIHEDLLIPFCNHMVVSMTAV